MADSLVLTKSCSDIKFGITVIEFNEKNMDKMGIFFENDILHDKLKLNKMYGENTVIQPYPVILSIFAQAENAVLLYTLQCAWLYMIVM